MSTRAEVNTREVEALISMIDDPDENIYKQIRKKIISYGKPIVPLLEEAWETEDLGDLFNSRVDALLKKIHFNDILDRMQAWITSKRNLMEGLMLICNYRYPDLNRQAWEQEFARIHESFQLDLLDKMPAKHRVHMCNSVLFRGYRFKEEKEFPHSSQALYLNEVIRNRRGGPLALSLIYLLVAQSLGLPIYWVDLPVSNISMLAYVENSEVKFFINARAQGATVDTRNIGILLESLKLEEAPEFYVCRSSVPIVLRQLDDLISAYEKEEADLRVSELSRLRELLLDRKR